MQIKTNDGRELDYDGGSIRFHYFHLGRKNNNKDKGVVAVMTVIGNDPKQNHKKYTIATFAFCSPKDMFTKSMAHQKTVSQLTWNVLCGNITMNGKKPIIYCTEFTGKTFNDAIRLFDNQMNKNDKPSWARKASLRKIAMRDDIRSIGTELTKAIDNIAETVDEDESIHGTSHRCHCGHCE